MENSGSIPIWEGRLYLLSFLWTQVATFLAAFRLLFRCQELTEVYNLAGRHILHLHCILRHIDPLLGNDRKINNETTAIARQQLCKYATVLEPLLGSGLRITMEALLEAVFSMGQLQGYIIQPTKLVQENPMWRRV
jgi:hypothetical protein